MSAREVRKPRRACRRNEALTPGVGAALDVLWVLPELGKGPWLTVADIADRVSGVSRAFVAQVLADAYERGLVARNAKGHGLPVKWARA